MDSKPQTPVQPLLFGKRKPLKEQDVVQYAGTDTELDIK